MAVGFHMLDFLLAAFLVVNIDLVPALSEFCKLLKLYGEFLSVLIPGVNCVVYNKES